MSLWGGLCPELSSVVSFFLCKGYDMSTFIRRYSNYLTKKAHTYTEAGYDFCRVSRG